MNTETTTTNAAPVDDARYICPAAALVAAAE